MTGIYAKSTKDCLGILNSYKSVKWKRVSKFNIKLGDSYQTVRLFTDGIETVSIVSPEYGETILMLIDLSTLSPLIEQIQEYAKGIYTHDYGEIYLDPWEMKIYAVGGDGGIFYTKKSYKEMKKLSADENYDWDDPSFKDVDFSHIPGIKETIVEAECSPDDDENYFQVAMANDVGNFE